MLLALLLAVAAVPAAPTRGFVLDEAKVLSGGHIELLNQRIKAISDRGAGQIGVLLTNDLRGKSRNELAPEVFRAWGIGYGDRGPTGRGRGVLILVKAAQPDRGVRIEVGRDLEGRLNDGKTGEIMRSVLPYFREGSWYQGLSNLVDLLGVEMVAEAIAVGAPARPPPSVPGPDDGASTFFVFGGLFLVVPLFFLLWGAFLFLRWWVRYVGPLSFGGGQPSEREAHDGWHRSSDRDDAHWSSGSSSSPSVSSSPAVSSERDSGHFGGGGDSGGGGSDLSF